MTRTSGIIWAGAHARGQVASELRDLGALWACFEFSIKAVGLHKSLIFSLLFSSQVLNSAIANRWHALIYEAVTSLPDQLPSDFASLFFHLTSLQVSNLEPEKTKRERTVLDMFIQSLANLPCMGSRASSCTPNQCSDKTRIKKFLLM